MVNTDGAAILDTEGGQITTLNSTGAMVWQALERGEDLDTIAATIVHDTGAEIDAVRADIRGFIEELRKKNLSSRRCKR
jgi:hypothetical protein